MAGVLAVIAARGGSKSVPRKNIALLGGKPLIAWTIEAARHARSITRTIVTTDDAEIASVARAGGADVPFMRPRELAADDTPGVAPIVHAVEWLDEHEGYRPDIVVQLQATSPLRTAADIDAAVKLLGERGASSVVSVTAVEHHPYWMKTVDGDGWVHDYVAQAQPTANRQELPPLYRLNGAIYAASRQVLLSIGTWNTQRTAAYIMPFERSVDIDTAWDLSFAQLVMDASRG